MDKETIDTSVLFPNQRFSYEPSFRKGLCRCLLPRLQQLDRGTLQGKPRLKGVALVPFQNVPAAVTEANRAVTKLGLAGITVASFGMKEHSAIRNSGRSTRSFSGSTCHCW